MHPDRTDVGKRARQRIALRLLPSVGQLGGLAGPYIIGRLNDHTHSLNASIAFIALLYLASGTIILSLRTHDPVPPIRSQSVAKSLG
jgi:MFS-type transporter involved in bile tolerance (Atg22 family)